VRQKRQVDERGGVSVPPLGMPRGRGRILRNHGFKPLLQQIAQVRFYAHVRQHSTEDDLADAALAELQYQVVRLRAKDPTRTHNDGLAVFDVGLEALEPVGSRVGEPLETQSSASQEHLDFGLIGLQWAFELPSAVRGKEIVRRDEDLEAIGLCGLEDPLHVLDGVVFRDTPAAGGSLVSIRSDPDPIPQVNSSVRTAQFQFGSGTVRVPMRLGDEFECVDEFSTAPPHHL
jgi:hypothetical protein